MNEEINVGIDSLRLFLIKYNCGGQVEILRGSPCSSISLRGERALLSSWRNSVPRSRDGFRYFEGHLSVLPSALGGGWQESKRDREGKGQDPETFSIGVPLPTPDCADVGNVGYPVTIRQ